MLTRIFDEGQTDQNVSAVAESQRAGGFSFLLKFCVFLYIQVATFSNWWLCSSWSPPHAENSCFTRIFKTLLITSGATCKFFGSLPDTHYSSVSFGLYLRQDNKTIIDYSCEKVHSKETLLDTLLLVTRFSASCVSLLKNIHLDTSVRYNMQVFISCNMLSHFSRPDRAQSLSLFLSHPPTWTVLFW